MKHGNYKWGWGLALLFLAAAGCNQPENPRGKIKLVLAVPADQRTREIYRSTVAGFEAAHRNISVQLLEIPFDYYTKVLVMMAGGNAPDLFWMGQSFGEFACRGTVLDISQRLAEERELATGDILPQAIAWYRRDGRQFGIAFGIDTEFIVYNKRIFDEAGIAYPHDDWDVNELLAKARSLTRDRDGDGRTDQYGFRGEVSPSAFGGAIVSEDGTRSLCNNPNVTRCLQFNLDLVHTWKAATFPDITTTAGLDEYSLFRQGRVAMMKMYTWNLPFFQERFTGMEWDIVNCPREVRRGHWASSQAILISSHTRHPDEAWLLCREFLKPEFQRAISICVLPTNTNVAREVIAKNRAQPSNLAALLKATDSLYPLPRIPQASELQECYLRSVDSVYSLRATPAEAMARAEKEMVRIIERSKTYRQ